MFFATFTIPIAVVVYGLEPFTSGRWGDSTTTVLPPLVQVLNSCITTFKKIIIAANTLKISVPYIIKLVYLPLTMEQHVFCIFIDYRGHHRKGVIYNAT
jgi:hypothetical protein